MRKSSNKTNPEAELELLKLRYPHLASNVLKVIEGTVAERVYFLKQDHWVGYPIADELLAEMFDLLDSPRISRMEGILIVSSPFNGKSTLLRRFRDKTAPTKKADGSFLEVPTLLVNSPSVADEKRFLQSILRELHSPYSSLGSTGSLESIVKEYFHKLGLKVLLIDESHNLISGDKAQNEVCINLFKSFMNDSQISIVAAGIPSAMNALQFDSQLETRFMVKVLPRWSHDVELLRLVLSFERLLPLREPSLLKESLDLVTTLFELSEGRIGELFRLMKSMAIYELRCGREVISEASLAAVSKLAPSKRKALLHAKF